MKNSHLWQVKLEGVPVRFWIVTKTKNALVVSAKVQRLAPIAEREGYTIKRIRAESIQWHGTIDL